MLKLGCYGTFKPHMRNTNNIIFRKLTRLLGRYSCTGKDSSPDWMSKKQGKNKLA
jgi:hypothetical protein